MRVRWKVILGSVILLACAAGLTRGLFAAQRNGVPSLRQANDEPTLLSTPTDLPPTPTETLQPTPELPTPESLTPTLEGWVGTPTYASDSLPGYAFRLEYDASLWGLTVDESGLTGLVHRQIPYCKIMPVAGRGLPRGWTTEEQFRDIGALRYDVIIASQNGAVQFVNYIGGNGIIQTGFQVSSQEQLNECLQAAETVLASLASVVAPTPTPTPPETPTASPTP